MKQILWAVFVVAAMATLFVACKTDETAAPVAGEGKISGTVTDKTTSAVLSGVTVSALGGTPPPVATGTNGDYLVTFSVETSTTVALTYSKSGYRDTTITYSIASATITPGNVVMTPRSVIGNPGGIGGSGLARTIAFLGANPQEIAVRGVGALETALLTWEVRDSLGLPIDASHAITLSVTVQNGPGGGEYVSPSPITTNGNGQAFTTVTSGTRSGVLQIVASGTVGSLTISTSPARVIINAGFPEQPHFTIATRNFNLPILFLAGQRTSISVLVGDRYSNPVSANTAVYFRSSAGVIQPSVFTNKDGQGSVDLISGNPQPFGVFAATPPGDGYHYVVARTVGQGGVAVTDSILVMWSGRSRVSAFTPTTFDIANGGSQIFTFTVSDFLVHPLAAGTAISVIATIPPPPDPNTPVNQVLVTFGLNGSLILEDGITPGPGATTFSARLSDGSSNINDPTGSRVTLTVSVGGPNGTASYTTDGLVH